MRVIWTDPALRDLALARAWIARDRPLAASGQVQRILEAAARLSDFPNLGRPGRRGGARELVIPGGPFIAVYKVRGERIDILRVFHGARRWPESL